MLIQIFFKLIPEPKTKKDNVNNKRADLKKLFSITGKNLLIKLKLCSPTSPELPLSLTQTNYHL
jgi:hypothetical protein